MGKLEKKAFGWNVVCAVLLLALAVCHFLPFWDGVSLQGYIWMPTEHTDVTDMLQGQLGEDFAVDSMVAMPVVVMICCLVGLTFGFRTEVKPWTGIAGTVGGAFALWSYLAKPAFRTGSGWVLHLVLALGILTSAVMAVYAAWKAANES